MYCAIIIINPFQVIPSSLLLVGNGALVLGYSLMRYTSVQSALRAGEFIIAKKGVLGVILATGVNTTGKLVGCVVYCVA
jgi:hypothetical protein